MKIQFKNRIGGVLTAADSVVLRDPTNTFGVRRTDTDVVIVASGTALAQVSTGVYEYTFTEPVAGLSYEYYVEYTYNGVTDRVRSVLQTQAAQSSGSVPIPNNAYVSMGVTMVSCGDAELEEFLNTNAATVWAMEARLGVVLDLRYQRFVLALIGLALDYVRMLIDREAMTQTTTETGYANSNNGTTYSSVTQRNRSSFSTQSQSSSTTSTRSAVRTSSSQMIASSVQASERAGTGTDTSTQRQAVINRSTASNDQIVRQSPLPSGSFTNATEQSAVANQYRNSHTHSESRMVVDEKMVRWTVSVPFVGNLSGQNGDLGVVGGKHLAKAISPDDSNSFTEHTSYEESDSDVRRRRKVATTNSSGGSTGVSLSDSLVAGIGSRNNEIQRSSHSIMAGRATQSSAGSMTSANHDEAHRESDSVFHSEGRGVGMSSASSLSNRTSTGASQMVSSSSLDRQYYSQIFESLNQMWTDTVELIRSLEQQVNLSAKFVVAKMTTTKPRATLTATCGLVTNTRLSPFGGGLDTRTVR